WDALPKDFTFYAVKYINRLDGFYLRRGEDVVTGQGGNSTLDTTTTRHADYIVKDEVVELITHSLTEIEFPVTVTDGQGQDRNLTLLLEFDDSGTITVSENASATNYTATGGGTFVHKSESEESWGDESRNAVYLDYEIDHNEIHVETADTLVLRERGVGMETFTPVLPYIFILIDICRNIMKYIYDTGFYLTALALLASGTKDNPSNFTMEKPQSVAVQDSFNTNYRPLKTYIDSVNSNFTLGAGVSLSEYNEQGVVYRLVNSNFQEVTTGYGMKHGAVVQSDGGLALEPVTDFLSAAEEAGILVYGHTLAWHANQNAEYLNSTIAPTLEESEGPTWDVISSADFETDDASNYQSNENAIMSFTADGEGANGEGRAL